MKKVWVIWNYNTEQPEAVCVNCKVCNRVYASLVEKNNGQDEFLADEIEFEDEERVYDEDGKYIGD